MNHSEKEGVKPWDWSASFYLELHRAILISACLWYQGIASSYLFYAFVVSKQGDHFMNHVFRQQWDVWGLSISCILSKLEWLQGEVWGVNSLQDTDPFCSAWQQQLQPKISWLMSQSQGLTGLGASALEWKAATVTVLLQHHFVLMGHFLISSGAVEATYQVLTSAPDSLKRNLLWIVKLLQCLSAGSPFSPSQWADLAFQETGFHHNKLMFCPVL